MSMFNSSTTIAEKFPENSLLDGIEGSTPTSLSQQQEKKGIFEDSPDTVSEPDRLRDNSRSKFVKNPFQLKLRGVKTSKRDKNMETLDDPPTPNTLDTAVDQNTGEVLERPVALSARLRLDLRSILRRV